MTRKGKGTKIMVLASGQGIPLGVELAAANRYEGDLALQTLDNVSVKRPRNGRPCPERIIADKGYDSRKLRNAMKSRGIDFIVPHLRTRRRKTQDGRKLRRYRRRWIVERTNAWLFNFRRLFVRYERILENYRGLLHFACALIAARHL